MVILVVVNGDSDGDGDSTTSTTGGKPLLNRRLSAALQCQFRPSQRRHPYGNKPAEGTWPIFAANWKTDRSQDNIGDLH